MLFNCCRHNRRLADAIRFLSADAIEKSKSGHPGMPLGMADVATVLFTKFIKINPEDAGWFDRDRFVLSAGHGSMLLYSLLYLLGYKDITIDDIKNFRQLGSKTAGHPEYGHLAGIDMTTGPLGQGISSAVGMALAERILNARFGDKLCNHYTYVINGDGCLMEGISEEAISLAGHLRLNKLIVFWDNNDITIDGHVSAANSTDQIKRFQACGWNTISIDGHNPCQIECAIKKAQKSKNRRLSPAKPKSASAPPPNAEPPNATDRRWVRKKLPPCVKISNGIMPRLKFPKMYLPPGEKPGNAAARFMKTGKKRPKQPAKASPTLFKTNCPKTGIRN